MTKLPSLKPKTITTKRRRKGNSTQEKTGGGRCHVARPLTCTATAQHRQRTPLFQARWRQEYQARRRRKMEETDNGRSNSSLLRRSVNDEEDLQTKRGDERPKEPWKGEYAKSVVYAGLDAIVTCFSLISSISAGRLSSLDVLVLGFANLVADGISMGFGDFMSSSTEKDVAAGERAVTEWEVDNNGGPERLALLQRYQALGMEYQDALTVVGIFSKYKDILVDEKLVNQKGMLPPDYAEKAWKNGLVTFLAFILFGSAPLLSFLILIPFTKNDSIKFAGACILSVLALAVLGTAKAKIAQQGYKSSIMFTVFNGAVAAAVAYGITWTLHNVAGVED